MSEINNRHGVFSSRVNPLTGKREEGFFYEDGSRNVEISENVDGGLEAEFQIHDEFIPVPNALLDPPRE